MWLSGRLLVAQNITVGTSNFSPSLFFFVYFHWAWRINKKYCFLLWIYKRQIWTSLFQQFVLILCSQSQYNFLPLLSITFPFPQFSEYHFVPSEIRPLSIAHLTTNTFRLWVWHLLYSAHQIIFASRQKMLNFLPLLATSTTFTLLHQTSNLLARFGLSDLFLWCKNWCSFSWVRVAFTFKPYLVILIKL